MKKTAITAIKDTWLWVGLVVGLIALIVTWTLLPEMPWISGAIGLLLVGDLVLLIKSHLAAFRTRSAAFGLQSVVTAVLVVGLVSVLNFLASKNTFKWDVTADKIHTLSDQTVKQLKSLKTPVLATLFSKAGSREKFRTLLDNYASTTSQFKVEYVDPDKEPARVKQAGVKKYDTLVLESNGRTGKIEEINEEKLTNELIKLAKSSRPELCALSGHGERDLNSKEATGYQLVKDGLAEQAYDVKDIQLLQEAKIPATCNAILLAGVSKPLLEKELKIISDYLDQGGRAFVAVDTELRASAGTPKEFWALLEKWNVKVAPAMIVDPLSKLLGADAATAVVTEFNKEHAIGRDFRGQALFPFARPLEVVTSAPAAKVQAKWIARTTPTAWGETELAKIGKAAVGFDAGKDLKGPLNVVVAVEGKRVESAPRATRLVVFGSSLVGTNEMARYGGNMDLVLNSISWVLEDESMISIRTKEEGSSKVELSQKAGVLIFWISVLIVPLLIAIVGIVVWVRRRRL